MKSKELNIVLMNMTVAGTVSGVNRYMDIIQRNLEHIPGLTIHTVLLVDKKDMLLHRIEKTGNSVKAIIPLPVNPYLIVKEEYWMDKYAEIVADLLFPFLKGLTNLIWHTHCINLSNLAVILKKRHGGKILTHLHCIPWKFNLEKQPEKFNTLYENLEKGKYNCIEDNFIETTTYKVSDHIICVTSSGKDYLTTMRQVDPRKITVIYNGIEDTAQQTASLPDSLPEILFAGRVSHSKGVKFLLNALRNTYRSGYSFHVTLAGEKDDRMIAKIKNNYRQLPLSLTGKISFEELQEKYRSCTIGIIPSLHEQCSYGAIEMAMYGIPMIVTDVDGLSEMFQHKKTALKIPLSFDKTTGLEVDEKKLTTAIIQLLSDKELRKKLSQNVRKHYCETFTAKIMTHKTVETYHKITE